MGFKFLGCGVLIATLTLPLGGCLETVGRPAYNHDLIYLKVNTCRPPNQSAGEVIGYGCSAKAA
jgi:hypothetical protein